MRKPALVVAILIVLVAASLVSPLGAFAASSANPPIPLPDTGARYPADRAPSGRLPAAPSISLGGPVACTGGFNAVASPNGAGYNSLNSVSAVNANDVWAVGSWSTASYDQTLIEHWDGTSWTIVPSSNPGPYHNDLNGVVAIATNDVWVVGAYTTSIPPPGYAPNTDAYAQHWNGTSWSVYVLRPYPSNFFAEINAITAISSTDVWAVGRYWSAGYLPYVEHWDGTSWTPTFIATPGPSVNNLYAVSAWSSTDVWAVGETIPSGTVRQSFAVHWNGISWSMVITPNTASGANLVLGVNALEAGHAVGVGFGNFVSGTSPRQSAAWDMLTSPGTSTITVLGTGLGTGSNLLSGVSRFGGGLQAVGYFHNTVTAPYQTLVIPAGWDSVAHALTWGVPGAGANPGLFNSALFATAALSPQAFWATGLSDASSTTATQTLTELYCAHVSITGPGPNYAGAPFSLTVTAQNPNLSTATSYRGTLHFTSSDSGAVLPADYTFTTADAGTHVFTGVVLNTAGNVTITAIDPVTSYVIGTRTFIVPCNGVCPAPGGTAGTRAAGPGPAGTAGIRDANQSGASPSGPRLPRLGQRAQTGDIPSGLALATAMGPAPTAGGAAPAAASTQPAAVPAVAAAPAPAEIPASQATVSVLSQTTRGEDMMAASRTPATKLDHSPGYLSLILIPLAIISMTLLVIRRRMTRRLIDHTRP